MQRSPGTLSHGQRSLYLNTRPIPLNLSRSLHHMSLKVAQAHVPQGCMCNICRLVVCTFNIRMYVCIYIYIYICIYVYMYICMEVSILYAYIPTYIHLHTYILTSLILSRSFHLISLKVAQANVPQGCMSNICR